MKYSYQHGDRPLDGYTVLRGLGRGGFGEVYYARSDGGREVALKVIQQNHDIELRGVRQCMNLKSPHLVSIFDVKLNERDVPFVIMEYVGGSSIRDIAEDNPEGLGRAQASYLVREIARGLEYLHSAGIVHRDLKPENIFFENGLVKIGDYGLSKYINVSRHSGQTMSVGTVQYMAPEIGSGSYTSGIDVYALGIIFYELLTGDVPFNGDSMGEILMKHLSVEPDLEPIDPLLRPVIEKALAKKPERRYADARAMTDALLAIPEIAAELGGVSPASICSQAPSAVGTPPELGPLPRVGEREEKLATADTAPVRYDTPPPRRLEDADASPAAPPLELIASTSWESQLVLAGCASAAMAIALSFLGASFRSGMGLLTSVLFFLSLFLGGTAIWYAHRRLLPNLGIEGGFAARMITTCVATVPLLVLSFPNPQHLMYLLPLLLGIALVDWGPRVHPERPSRFSLEQALLAGLTGGIVFFVFVLIRLYPSNPFTMAGVLAGLSLVANAIAPFQKAGKQTPVTPDRPAESGSPSHDAPASPTLKAAAALAVAQRKAQKAAEAGYEAGMAGAAAGEAAAEAAWQKHEDDNAFQRTPDLNNPTGTPHPLVLPRAGGMIFGVAAGLARYLRWDPVWVRLLFVVGFFFWGSAILVYLVLYFLMPEENWFHVGAEPRQRGGFAWSIGRGLRKVFAFGRVTALSGAGLILIGLGSVIAFLGSLWAGGFGHGLFSDLVLPREATLEFCRNGFHLLMAMANYAAGVFLCLLARRDDGAWHVLRAASAWLIGGVLLGVFSMGLSAAAQASGAQDHFAFGEWLSETTRGWTWDGIFLLFFAVMIFVLLLAWPRRRESLSESHHAPAAGETTRPFKADNRSGAGWALLVTLAVFAVLGLFVSLMVLS